MNVTVWRNYFPAAILLGACADSVTAAEPYRYLNGADITVVDWAIPAAYVSSGYEVLNESGQLVHVVPPAKTDTELERDAVAARAQEAEATAQAAQLERDTFLLRRYSAIQYIEAARDRSLRELDIRIAILSRDTLSQQLGRHQSALDATERSGSASPQYEEETVAALKAEIQSLDEASEGRRKQAAALAQA